MADDQRRSGSLRAAQPSWCREETRIRRRQGLGVKWVARCAGDTGRRPMETRRHPETFQASLAAANSIHLGTFPVSPHSTPETTLEMQLGVCTDAGASRPGWEYSPHPASSAPALVGLHHPLLTPIPRDSHKEMVGYKCLQHTCWLNFSFCSHHYQRYIILDFLWIDISSQAGDRIHKEVFLTPCLGHCLAHAGPLINTLWMNTKMKEGGISLAPGQILSLSLFPHLLKGLLEAGLTPRLEPGTGPGP